MKIKVKKFYDIPEFNDYAITKTGIVKKKLTFRPYKNWLMPLHVKILIQMLDRDGYPFVLLRKNGKQHHKKVHKLMQITFFNNTILQIDHINRIRSDNNLNNLHLVTLQQNQHNKSKIKNTSSKYKGVSYHGCGKWVANIKFNKRPIYIGLYKDERQAAYMYNRAAKKYFKEYAYLNEIDWS